MRLLPKTLATLGLMAGAMTALPAMATDHSAEIAKFESSCIASGSAFKQVGQFDYRCTAASGSFEQCNYSGAIGWCSGQDAAAVPTTTGAHRTKHPLIAKIFSRG